MVPRPRNRSFSFTQQEERTPESLTCLVGKAGPVSQDRVGELRHGLPVAPHHPLPKETQCSHQHRLLMTGLSLVP